MYVARNADKNCKIMKNEQIISVVKNLGLSDSEARVYFAALSLGPTTVLKISRASEIKRATVYTVIDTLVNKGFMRIEPRGFKRLFAVENPASLESALERRKRKFKDILPVLETLYNQREGSSVIKYYEGIEAVKGVYDEFLKDFRPHDDYFAIANMEKWLGQDEDYFMKWRTKRAKLFLNTRMIFEDNEIGRRFKKQAANFNEKVKLLPKGKQVETSLLVTPRRALLQQYPNPVTVLVNESKTSIRLYQEMFDIMWNALPE